MQVYLHGITNLEVHYAIDLLDLVECRKLAVTMQVWKPRQYAYLETSRNRSHIAMNK